jgi:hypothetical protein
LGFVFIIYLRKKLGTFTITPVYYSNTPTGYRKTLTGYSITPTGYKKTLTG